MSSILAFLSLLPQLFKLFLELRDALGEREAVSFVEDSVAKFKLIQDSIGGGKTDEEKIALRREALRRSADLWKRL